MNLIEVTENASIPMILFFTVCIVVSFMMIGVLLFKILGNDPDDINDGGNEDGK